MDWVQTGVAAGLGLTATALLLLAVAPIGWRAGWWHFRFAFSWLMSASGFAAAAGAAASLLTLLFGLPSLDAPSLFLTLLVLGLALILAYLPWHYDHLRSTAPRIHDITTDTEDPPPFSAVLSARAAEMAASAAYEGPELARQQVAAYPDLQPHSTALPPEQAFRRALDVAREMPGWKIVHAEPALGRIEASQTSRWFGFTDDVVIRVRADGPGSRIDMRSLSRQGRSDFGVNAARIRSYMAALRR